MKEQDSKTLDGQKHLVSELKRITSQLFADVDEYGVCTAIELCTHNLDTIYWKAKMEEIGVAKGTLSDKMDALIPLMERQGRFKCRKL